MTKKELQSAYVAPAKTPKNIIERLNREIVRALHTPEIIS